MWDMFFKDDWDISEVTDGNYSAFVYVIQFPDDGSFYFGFKQVFRRIKDAKKIKGSTVLNESDWKTYSSSSKTVQQRIDNGEHHTKHILWCFASNTEATLVETALIALYGTRYDCLNKAIMAKTKLRKDKGLQLDVIRRIMECF
ncbi:hypothetical protein AIP16_21670 [Salmonella enterica]|nr:hypothetical protein [Salmonella enterica]